MSDEPKYKNVKYIQTLRHDHEVNSFLAAGWFLLEVYKTYDGPRDLHDSIRYVVAWDKDEKPVFPEKDWGYSY
ncbi:MAG: hypothetical protein GX766_10850 [Firmicutes bacterium]|jgi:hypothetical protein|nr:hypothetical protein [Bacillota bacterium]